jgi:hypothetical protein
MSSKPTIAAISASVVILFAGCERDREQPWRKALDEGKVVRLGGGVGKLTPSPGDANVQPVPPPIVVQPAPIVVQPTPTGAAANIKKPAADDLPIPPPPKAAEKKASSPNKDDEPSLGPPR